MRASPNYSRRRFLHAGTTGVAATVVAATTPVRAAAEAAIQAPPPTATAPRILRKPPLPELDRIARSYNLNLSRDDLTSFRNLMDGVLASYRRLDQFAEPTLAVKYPREAGFRPPASDNRLNAWYWRCSIKGATSGALAGKKIAIKDNVCVAGIPMMNGSNVLEGYVPDVDATIVTRILDAGGEIIGKAVCEHLCFSGGSHTSDTGPVLNPHDPKRSAGGSSSGSAALVVAGECEELSPVEHSERLINTVKGPKQMVVYQESRHSVGNVPSANLGPFPPILVADWLADRLAGKPFASEHWFVRSNGQIDKMAYKGANP